ncbi:hypothetical protein SDC9_66221 [bioreactor metagenome]|uniref:ATPase domain-containing protein n=1 Tax=bioreactor metagenome TaxID=1076179 RepID=A0A644XUF7_9ZZZZ
MKSYVNINPFSKMAIRVDKENYKEKFIGREREIFRILDNLFQSQKGNISHMFIYGEEGVGKTSLFNYIKFIVSESKDIYGFNAEEYFGGRLYYTIAETNVFERKTLDESINPLLINLEENFKRQRIKLSNIKFSLEWPLPYFIKGKFETTISNDKINIPLDVLEQLSSTLEKSSEVALESGISGILLVIDNIDFLVKDFNIGQFFKVLSERLINRNSNVVITFIGSEHALEKMIEQEPSVSGILDKIKVNNFNISEITRCLNISKDNGVIFDEESINLIYEYTNGNPALVQQIAHETFRRYGGEINIEQITEIIEDKIQDQVYYLKSKLKHLDFRHKALLNRIVNMSGRCNKDELEEYFQENILENGFFNHIEFQSCIKYLERYGFSKYKDGTLMITNKLILETLKREDMKYEYS